MTDPRSESPSTQSSSPLSETSLLSVGDRTPRVDRSLTVLANRRRRFCLYYLHEAETSIAVRDLAEAVEIAVIPSETAVTDRILEDALHRFTDIHLPKLHALGFVRVQNDQVELASDPPLPLREVLPMTAEIEFDTMETEWPPSDRPLEELAQR